MHASPPPDPPPLLTPPLPSAQHYQKALPHKTAPQIYGRWSFWKMWLPEESAQEDIYDTIKSLPKVTATKKRKKVSVRFRARVPYMPTPPPPPSLNPPHPSCAA